MIKELFDLKNINQFLKKNKDLKKYILESLQKYKKLPKIKTKHRLNFIYLWNSYGTLPFESYKIKFLLQDIESMMVCGIMEFNKNQGKKPFNLILKGVECFNCGSYMDVYFFENGDFETRKPYGEEKHVFDCFTKSLIKTKVVFKTGNLLISDYFRDEKNTLSEYINKEKKFINLNFTKGLMEEHLRYLKHQIIKVQVGNTCPSVYQNKNELVFKSNYEDENPKNKKGYVCTDLWAVTIIEKANYEKILHQNGYSNKEIRDIIKKTTQLEIKVSKGVYECTSNLVKQHLKSSNKEILYFTLKKVK